MTLRDWKDLAVTQVILNELKTRQQFLKEELGKSAGMDILADRYKVGAIAAYEDMLNIELDEETHDN